MKKIIEKQVKPSLQKAPSNNKLEPETRNGSVLETPSERQNKSSENDLHSHHHPTPGAASVATPLTTLGVPHQSSHDHLAPEDSNNNTTGQGANAVVNNKRMRLSQSQIIANPRRLSTMSNLSHGSQESTTGIDYSGHGAGGGSFSMSHAAIPHFLDEAPSAQSKLARQDSFIRNMIPCLPLPAAVVCLLVNIVLPGFGTVLSGFLTLCVKEDKQEGRKPSKVTVIMTNLVVGISQLSTITFLLVGWFWSIAWGIYMINLSLEHQKFERQQRQRELQQKTLNVLLRSDKSGNPGSSSGGAIALKSLFSSASVNSNNM